MESILQVHQLSGGYFKKHPVLHDVSFSVAPGEMVGLIGLNGAGKSTTIKHILGLLQPIQGSITIHNKTLQESPGNYRSAFSYVPETPLFYEDLTLQEHLELTAMAYGISREIYEDRVEQLLVQFNMEERRKMFPAHLSKGMRQKLMIINAFLVEPALYIVDEPFVGLDPVGIRSLLDLMVERKNKGAGILISSHILSTLERYCDRFIILHRGRIIAAGSLEGIRQQANMPGALLDDVFYHLTGEANK